MKQKLIQKNGLRLLMALLAMALLPTMAHAQKFALIDMAEVEALNNEASTLYKNYQNEVAFLSQEQKKAKQEQIMNKEKAAADLKKRYFGPEGELFKKRESLMAPIQEEVYNAVKEVADYRGYSLVLDRSSDQSIIFGSPRIDISNEVLQRLGYNR